MSFLTDRYKEMGGEVKFIKPRRCIRVNTQKISVEELKSRLEKKHIEMDKVPFLKNAFFVKSKFNLVSSPEYLLGLFYIQDAASQIPAEVLNPKSLTLDMCASPGSKTTQLCEKVPVIAVDNNKDRFKAIENNLERLGFDNCIAYLLDAREINKKFDSIMLDAPCSGNYILEEDWLKKTNLKRIEERSYLQMELISKAISLLNKDGVLVYSTCSLEPEEDEFVIQFALDNFPVKLEKIDCIGDDGLTNIFGKKLNPTMKYCKRLWPYKTNTIGFFVARLRKC